MQQNESVQCSIHYASAALPGDVAFMPHINVPYFYGKYQSDVASRNNQVAFKDVVVHIDCITSIGDLPNE